MLIDKSHQASFLTYDIHSHYWELILIIINMTLTYSFPQIHRWLFFQPVSFYLFGFSRKRNIYPLLWLVIWIQVYYGLWSGYISWLIVRQGEGTMVFIADKISKLQCSKLLKTSDVWQTKPINQNHDWYFWKLGQSDLISGYLSVKNLFYIMLPTNVWNGIDLLNKLNSYK